MNCVWQDCLEIDTVKAVTGLARAVGNAGGRAFLVGGAVRDILLGINPTDFDMEIFGLPVEALERVLQTRGRFDAVGKAFGVYKLAGLPIDVSLPRRERKVASGHRGFEVEPDPRLSVEAAASRRDFTLNAILLDPLTNELIDPHKGIDDLHSRRLRHTSEAFSEDPLRVLRAMQFIARFKLTPAQETIDLCRRIVPEDLAPERCFEEFKKLLLLGLEPSRGLTFLRETDWIRYWPELAALINCLQDPLWHPEGDVWDHTLHCLDAFAHHRSGDAHEDLVVGFAVLCHDLGKPLTTAFIDGRWRSPGHDTAGEAPTRTFLSRLTNRTRLTDDVVALVVAHMRPMSLRSTEAGPAAIRRLARDVGRIDRLLRVVEADGRGRPPLDEGDVAPWLRIRAEALAVEQSAPTPWVQGRDLLPLGFKPGPELGRILRRLYEEQLDGRFSNKEEALDSIKEEPSTSLHPKPQDDV